MPAVPSDALMKSKFCNLNSMSDSRSRKRDNRKWSDGYDGIRWNSKKEGKKNYEAK